MSEQYYKFLNKGEIIQPNDEFYVGGCWHKVGEEAGEPHRFSNMYRRPIPAPGWPEPRSVKDDPPKEGQAVLVWDHDGWYFNTAFPEMDAIYDWWLPQPPAPPQPRPDWEVAMDGFRFGGGHPLPIEANAFKAGYEAAQAAMKKSQ